MKEIRPDYYKSNGLEAFDVIDAYNFNFNLGNAFKYMVRAGKKEDEEKDIRKAMTYLKREMESIKKSKAKQEKYLDGVEEALKYE